MNQQNVETFQKNLSRLLAWLKHAFEVTATWVTQLSWWKFAIFAIVALICGSLLQNILFSPNDEPIAQSQSRHKTAHVTPHDFSDGDTDVHIDSEGIHISHSKSAHTPASPPAVPAPPAAPRAPGAPAQTENQADKPAASENESGDEEKSEEKSDEGIDAQVHAQGDKADVHVKLPPEISKEVGDAINEAVDDAAEQRVEGYRKKSSEWFMNFVLLLVVGLFGTKALMGGKKRAEAQAMAANAAAEREALQRQVTEAKMQMMQAQVEPHFLFNTLASVEHLIETDPPRASAMQRSLIQYLRATLPQMRENGTVINLGREADLVKSYLNLLKVRMEERLQINFDVPEGLRSAAFPPMMLQSLVENAIKHGLEPKAEGGTLSVKAEVMHNKLRVTVTDDGLGFGAVPSNGTGLGLQSIRERLKLLHGQDAQLAISPNTPSGVCSMIEVPYQLAK